MKRVMYFASAALLLAAPAVYSQMPAGQKIGLATSLQRGYAGIKTNFTAAAEKMPEADYTFKVGSMPEARTYGQLIAHIAQAQFGQCAGLTGVPNPMAGKNLEQELKTKAELTKALADSFAICDKAFEAVTDANATELIKLMNRSPFHPLEIHLNDGSSITVHEPFSIATARTSPCFIVYTAEKMDVVAYRNVTKVTTPVGVE